MTAHLGVAGLPDDVRPVAAWASALLLAVARDEAAGRRTQRVTEPALGTWARFQGRLTATDLLDLVFEDAAVLHRVPFDAKALDPSLRLDRLPIATAEAWLQAIGSIDLKSPGGDYITEQARGLGLPTRLARTDLHIVKPHQKVLELPGSGGQLAHHLVTTQKELTLQANVTVACSTWQELTLAGIVALEQGAPNTDFVVRAGIDDLREPKNPVRQRSFDFVVGIHPEKGGLFRIEDQLAIWFPGAKVLLV